ncbi:peptide chain release factor N(5)-glutamine methyltransferase [Phaeovulum sp.]|uniref:peptide chain release factor N(5)-glutamine methyltransferase n=1 Tax=Phaeovulum sp. TaxID=2934796 RepID=UPI00356B3283
MSDPDPLTGTEALRLAVQRLAAAGIETPAADARRLLAHAMRLAPDRLTLESPRALSSAELAAFDAALAQRLRRQPVAQILGFRQFWGRDFRVTRATLDPRPETETLVAEALTRPFARVLDLGTGTGCILLSLLAERPAARGLGIDASPEALAVARENAAALGLEARAELRLGDWFDGVQGQFDLIVSNPPYIAAAEMPGLAPEVRDWEPALALTPGGDGLAAYRAIAAGARDRLAPSGRLLLEIGPTQALAVIGLLAANGLPDATVLTDLDGRDRVVSVWRNS